MVNCIYKYELIIADYYIFNKFKELIKVNAINIIIIIIRTAVIVMIIMIIIQLFIIKSFF